MAILLKILGELVAILFVLIALVIIVAIRRSRENNHQVKSNNDMEIEIKNIEPMQVAAVRHVGPYMGDAELFGRLFGKVCGWAGPKGLMGADTKYVSAYYENPEAVPPEELRLDVCLTVPEGTEGEGDVEVRELPGGSYAVGIMEATKPEDYAKGWNDLVAWINENGYEMEERPAYELYEGEQHGPNRTVQFHLAVKEK